MKKIILLLSFLIFNLPANAETIKDVRFYSIDTHLKKFNQENFPVMYEYFKNYAENVLYKFDITKYPSPGCFLYDTFYIQKDGKLLFSYTVNKNNRDRYALWKFINDNPPPPFPKEMTDEKIKIRLSLANDIYYKENIIRYNSMAPINRYDEIIGLEISIDKDNKNKRMSKKKCQKLDNTWDESGNFCRLKYRASFKRFD